MQKAVYVYEIPLKSKISSHYLSLTLQVPLRDLRRPGLSEPRPVEEGNKLWITYSTYFFDHSRIMKGLPGWVISSTPGLPLRQHEHERRYTTGTHSFIPTRWIWNDYYGGQMISRELVGLKVPDVCLKVRKPRKNLTQETCPHWGSNPDMRACYRLFHSGGRDENIDPKLGKWPTVKMIIVLKMA